MAVRRANAPLLPVDRSQILLGGSLREGHRSLHGGDSCLFLAGSVMGIRSASKRKDYFGWAVHIDES
jgi:hypothetical protein